VGIDNYDLAALARRGIRLCNTPGVLTETTADMIFALVMGFSDLGRELLTASASVMPEYRDIVESLPPVAEKKPEEKK